MPHMHPQKYAQKTLEVGAACSTENTPGTSREAISVGAIIQLKVPWTSQ
jgi:hypothetical protein